MKKVVCDSSSIIALSMNCLLWLLGKFKAEFYIPLYVRKEIFDVPVSSPKYGFEAMRNGLAIGNILKVRGTNVKLRKKVMDLGNSLLKVEGRPIQIIHAGEADAIALALSEGIDTFLVDEKNTRFMIENREILRESIQRRMHKKVEIDREVEKEIVKLMGHLKVIRSTEILAVAVKRGILDWPYTKKDLLRNALYALKFSGCAITEAEIVELVNLVVPTKVI